MFVTRFWLNYWTFATMLLQCLSQGFDSNIGYLPQDFHNVCYKVLRSIIVATRLPQCLSQGFGSIIWLLATRV